MTMDWIAADWPPGAHVLAGTTVRRPGASSGVYEAFNLGAHVGDEPAAVAANRRQIADLCGGMPVWLEQVHGTAVAVDPDGSTVPVADAAVSRQSGATLAVMTADCLPLLLATADGSEVGVAHAGWRGLADGVIEAVVAAFRSAPAELHAWLGPAISQASFEVGGEVRERFADADPAAAAMFEKNDRGRWQGDLYGLARQRLEAAGVSGITGGGFCTCTDSARFFSYRRDGQCGRMASFVRCAGNDRNSA